jgi:DNA-binding response OmpR family regulator
MVYSPLTDMEQILCISWDPTLALTRELLLKREGYSVQSAWGAERAVNCCRTSQAGLLVLGHSVPREEKRKLIAIFKAQNKAPVLSLLPLDQMKLPEADYGVSADPASLLSAVRAILPS